MPRISAPTLAEHRSRQRAAVLRAAEDIVVEEGAGALTVAAVAARTGLARPSVYAYVRSTEDLLVALVQEGFGRWTATLEDTSEGARTPDDVVRSWFHAAARSAHAGNHRLAAALAGVHLPAEARQALEEGHRRTARPLAEAARDLGAPDPAAATALVHAVVGLCIDRVEAGAEPGAEADRAADFALGGLRALAGRAPAPGPPPAS